MRGLEKTAPDGADTHTDGHGDSMTNSAQWGRVGENFCIGQNTHEELEKDQVLGCT